jgi:hypothetical protein
VRKTLAAEKESEVVSPVVLRRTAALLADLKTARAAARLAQFEKELGIAQLRGEIAHPTLEQAHSSKRITDSVASGL